MGQGQHASLTDSASSRPLPDTSTLQQLCGVSYTYAISNADDAIYAMYAMRILGFLLVKNIFEPTTDAMVEACKEKSGGREAFGNRGPNRIDTNTNTSNTNKY